jgi:hypothetical protein
MFKKKILELLERAEAIKEIMKSDSTKEPEVTELPALTIGTTFTPSHSNTN